MANVFTEEGYELYKTVIFGMTNDELLIARRRALKCEKFRYNKELAGIDTPPAREKQLQIEIIEAAMRDRCMKIG